MQQVRELPKSMNASPRIQYESEQIIRACGGNPKDKKVRELGGNLRYARLLSGFLPKFLAAK